MRSVIPVLLVLAMAALMVLAGCPSKPPTTAPPQGKPPIPVTAGSPTAPATDNAAVTDATAADPKVLFETKCKLCHTLDKATSEKLDQAGWEETVKEMAAKKAGWISDAEAAAITRYVVATYSK